MFEPLGSNRKDENPGLPWDTCVMCGELNERGLVPFKTGTTPEPIQGELLTGVSKRQNKLTVVPSGFSAVAGVVGLVFPPYRQVVLGESLRRQRLRASGYFRSFID